MVRRPKKKVIEKNYITTFNTSNLGLLANIKKTEFQKLN